MGEVGRVTVRLGFEEAVARVGIVPPKNGDELFSSTF